MTPGEALREYLSHKDTVTAICGSRIFGDKAEAADVGPHPYIVYSMPSNVEPGHLTGVTTLSRATLQINCWARKKPDSERLREAVRDVLQTFKGTVSNTEGSLSIRSVRFSNSADAFVPDDGNTGDYSAGITLSMWHRVAVPAGV
mgnify:CR=1 FL=1